MMKQASLDQAQANLSYTTIYAPVDGVILSRSVDVIDRGSQPQRADVVHDRQQPQGDAD